jgi:hypothetical protein
MAKALAIILFTLALEAAFLLHVALVGRPARTVAPAAQMAGECPVQDGVAKAPAAAPGRC